jgi:hypothetical protein
MGRDAFYRECLDNFLIENPRTRGVKREDEIEPTAFPGGVTLQAWQPGTGYEFLAEYEATTSFEDQMWSQGSY